MAKPDAGYCKNAILHIAGQCPTMTPWRFTEYITEELRFPFSDWYSGQPVEVKAQLDFVIGLLRNLDSLTDDERRFKVLTGDDVGLSEIRFSVEAPHPTERKKRKKLRVRPLGIYRPEQREFLMLTGAIEWGKGYLPKGVFAEAHRLMRAFGSGRGGSREF